MEARDLHKIKVCRRDFRSAEGLWICGTSDSFESENMFEGQPVIFSFLGMHTPVGMHGDRSYPDTLTVTPFIYNVRCYETRGILANEAYVLVSTINYTRGNRHRVNQSYILS